MVELETKFPKRDENSLRINVDYHGLAIEFWPEETGEVIGIWFPNQETAENVCQLYQEYVEDREFKWALVDEEPLGESYLNWKQVDKGLTKIEYKRVGERYSAQLNDTELDNLFGTLRQYFSLK